ncbi:MAG: SpoVG family protein, partial [Firmicutes bacterium]|nr:SpoVG family protein [Bacillota bacterium]
MNIRANVTPINNDTALKGLATVYVNNSIAIGSVRIMESEEKGLFVKMPSKKNFRSGEYEDIVFPITKEAREQINNAVIEAY